MEINNNILLLREIEIDGLGKIYSPTVDKMIKLSDKQIEDMSLPFLISLEDLKIDEEIIKNIENTINRKFTVFDYLTSYEESTKNILRSLQLFYKTEDIYVYQDIYEKKFLVNYFIRDERYYPNDNATIISYNNWDILCKLIKKLMFIFEDKNKEHKIEVEHEENRAILEEFLRLQRQKLEEEKKLAEKSKLLIHDIVTVVASDCQWDYDRVLNMTYYRLMNSYRSIMYKDNYKTNLMYHTSEKFDTSNMKIEHWTESIRKGE